MTTLTGILDWSQRAEGRIRQWSETLIRTADDPIVPADLADRFGLRHGQEITVELSDGSPPGPRPGRGPVNRPHQRPSCPRNSRRSRCIGWR